MVDNKSFTDILYHFSSCKIVFVLVNSFLTTWVDLIVLLPSAVVCFNFCLNNQ